MNFSTTTIMPFLARLVVAAAMLTSGWVNCFSQVEIRAGIAEGLRSMDVEVRFQVPEVPVVEDGEELSFSYHRRVLTIGDDLSGESDEVKALSSSLWTQEVSASWSTHQTNLNS